MSSQDALSDGGIPPRSNEVGRAVNTVLVVDDSRAQLRLLSNLLRRWDLAVIEAESGEEALNYLRTEEIDMVLSDWMMPGMTGPQLCEALRSLELETYTYFILLSSKTEKQAVAKGLDDGADEYLTKPVNAAELRARIRAAERILEMERELIDKNKLLSTTLDELKAIYHSLDRDLIEARHLQQSLVPERHLQFDGGSVSLLLRPSGHVGGDLVGAFRVNESRIGIYSIDVSGHGIASALMTARLAAYLTGSTPENNVALTIDDLGFYSMRPTEEICMALNSIVLDQMETEQYFTMAIADCDLRHGRIVFSQAGHPMPLIQRSDGSVEFVGGNSMPIGLLDDPVFSTSEVDLKMGDRLLLYSDGVSECPTKNGDQLEEDGLEGIVRKIGDTTGEAYLEAMVWHLSEFAGEENFPDDVSAALLEFGPPAAEHEPS